MPGMNGIDTLRAIRAEPRTRLVPVVFVSVFADHGVLAGEWVVPKPIDSGELGAVLAVAVASGRTRVLAIGRDGDARTAGAGARPPGRRVPLGDRSGGGRRRRARGRATRWR